MDRLQKKCFFAATGLHLSLLLILLIGPGFMSSQSRPDNMPLLDFVPLKTVDALLSGGGNPNAQPPPAPPEPVAKPVPPPQPEKAAVPDPPRDPKPEVKPPDSKPESVEPSTDRKPRKPFVDLTPVVRSAKEAKAQDDTRAREEAREQARREANRRRAAAALANAANSIAEGRASSTKIELKGPGGGGVPYANFLQAVKSAYTRAWSVPDGIADNDATVDVSVTIARDGTVVPGSARITRASSNAAVDRSVQVTLDRVKYAAPLPDDAKEDQRTVTITFSVRAKRSLG